MLIYFINNKKKLKTSFNLNINCIFDEFILAIAFLFLLLYLNFYHKLEIFLEETDKSKFFSRLLNIKFD